MARMPCARAVELGYHACAPLKCLVLGNMELCSSRSLEPTNLPDLPLLFRNRTSQGLGGMWNGGVLSGKGLVVAYFDKLTVLDLRCIQGGNVKELRYLSSSP